MSIDFLDLRYANSLIDRLLRAYNESGQENFYEVRDIILKYLADSIAADRGNGEWKEKNEEREGK